MPDLPARISRAALTRDERAALGNQRRTELAVHNHALAAFFDSECDRIDSQAASDAVKEAITTELDVLDFGMQRAAGSEAQAQVVADKVAILSRANSARIARRFGA